MIAEKILVLGGIAMFLLGIVSIIYLLLCKKANKSSDILAAQFRNMTLISLIGFIMSVNGFAIYYQTADQQKEVRQLNDQVKELKKENTELRSIFGNSSNEVNILTEENESLKLENKRLSEENNALRQSNDELTNQIKEMKEQKTEK